jgi:Protein of unknown function DUF262
MHVSKKKAVDIDTEISDGRNEIRTDKLDISYGELANMYENKELIIRPEYQRLFRWSPTQKSRFVESILLGFPTPAIFVAEDEKGIWELVDGLQRVSTVLEFMGFLCDAEGKNVPPSVLIKAGHRPRIASIDGAKFKDLSLQVRLAIKRAGCRVEVIKTGSKPEMKYEVFERLNTGGSELTQQEVRNCIFRATNPEFVEWVESLAKFAPFNNSLCLSDLQEKTMFDRGLVLRYLAMKNAYSEFEHDVEPFITDFVRDVVEKKRPFDQETEGKLFKSTFRKVYDALGEDAWRHWRGGHHKGGLSVYVFETISVGIAQNISTIAKMTENELAKRIVSFKQQQKFEQNTGAGANIKSRLLSRIEFAIQYFS